MKRIEFVVHGRPAVAGSKKAFPIRRKDGSLGVAVAPMGKGIHEWRGMVIDAANRVFSGPILAGPIALRVLWLFPRPKNHYGTGKNAERLKDDAPTRHTKMPDLTKLLRALEDALTGTLWRDDAQVCDVHAEKVYSFSGRYETRVIVQDVPR